MEYNVCQICGACDGRAGFLVGSPTKLHACQNCDDTRETGKIVIHSYLARTGEELEKTFAILKPVINNELVLYAVRNSKGQYFRAKGYSSTGATWVDDINKGKIYGGTGPARATITWFANNFKDYPTPDLIKLTVTGIEVIDEGDRVAKAKQKKAEALVKREKYLAQQRLQRAQRDLDDAQARLNNLKK